MDPNIHVSHPVPDDEIVAPPLGEQLRVLSAFYDAHLKRITELEGDLAQEIERNKHLEQHLGIERETVKTLVAKLEAGKLHAQRLDQFNDACINALTGWLERYDRSPVARLAHGTRALLNINKPPKAG